MGERERQLPVRVSNFQAIVEKNEVVLEMLWVKREQKDVKEN